MGLVTGGEQSKFVFKEDSCNHGSIPITPKVAMVISIKDLTHDSTMYDSVEIKKAARWLKYHMALNFQFLYIR